MSTRATQSSSEAAKAANNRANRARSASATAGVLDVDLDSGRWRHLVSSTFWLVAAALMTFGIGGVGVWVGAILALVGLHSLRGFVLSLLHPPGRVEIDDNQALLPRGLCKPNPLSLQPVQVRHAYFLRRAVPLTQAAPVLVVETEEGTVWYPRDWFTSDADQIRLARALNAQIEKSSAGTSSPQAK